MIASVDDLHVTLRGNPVLRGVSLSVRPGRSSGWSASPAPARACSPSPCWVCCRRTPTRR
ncbi:hypothetical protein [Paractinoplanes durhamensis]|uniref:hypothetical protein n=1 Tax=Paractinoplanes durhamensis TaxID=113563 RepID=UPI00363E8E15